MLGLSDVAAGNCAFRTNDFSAGPGAFRGWGGRDYDVEWRSPYLSGGSEGAGKCVTQVTNSSTPFDAHVCIRRLADGGSGSSSQGFVAVGPHPAGVRYSFCKQAGGEAFEQCAGDYASWSGPQTLSLSSAVSPR